MNGESKNYTRDNGTAKIASESRYRPKSFAGQRMKILRIYWILDTHVP